jgi:hypothetical protein
VPNVPQPHKIRLDSDRNQGEGEARGLTTASPPNDDGDIAFRNVCSLSEILNQVLDLGGQDGPDRTMETSSQLALLYTELQKGASTLPLEEEYVEKHCREHSHVW